MPKKRGRPSRADIAARQALKASQEAAKAQAAAGKAAAEQGAVPVATADLDPPTQQSASVAPDATAAVTQHAAKAAAAKAAAKRPTMAVAPTELTGNAGQPKPPASKGRPLAGNAQKPSTAVAARQNLQKVGKHVLQAAEDDDDNDEGNALSHVSDDVPVSVPAAAAPKPGGSKRLKRLRKQQPSAQIDKAQAKQHAVEHDDTAPAKAHVVHSQGSELSREQRVSVGEPKTVEVMVDAVGLLLEPADAGCARARPWVKHTQKAAEEAHAADQAQTAAEASPKLTEVDDTSTGQPRSAAAAQDPRAVAATQDSIGQVGSGGSGLAGAAEQSAQNKFHGRASAAEAQQQAQQQDQHSEVQRQHAPRGSRTSPRSPVPLPTATQPKHADSRTGTSQPRGGTSQPTQPPAGRNGNASGDRRTQHRQVEDKFEEAPASDSPSDGARSGDSSDNATVQHGVGHTGESSEALPASMKSSKPAVQLQRQQQHQQQPPTSSISEQAIHSAAGNTKPGTAQLALCQTLFRCTNSVGTFSTEIRVSGGTTCFFWSEVR